MPAYVEAEQWYVRRKFAQVGLHVRPYILLRGKDLVATPAGNLRDQISADTSGSGPFLTYRASATSNYRRKMDIARRLSCPVMIDIEPVYGSDATARTAYNTAVAHVSQYVRTDAPSSTVTLYESPVRNEPKLDGSGTGYFTDPAIEAANVAAYTSGAYADVDELCIRAYQSYNFSTGNYPATLWVPYNVASAESVNSRKPWAQVWAECFDTPSGNYSYPSHPELNDAEETQRIADELLAEGVEHVLLFGRVDGGEYTEAAVDSSFARMRILLEPFAESLAGAWDIAVNSVGTGVRNRWKLDELQGTTAADTGTGTPRDGVIQSAVTQGRGNHLTQAVSRRACMSFPRASNGQINISGWTMPSGAFSLALWFKTDTTGVIQYIFSHGTDTSNYLHVLVHSTNVVQVRGAIGGSSISASASAPTIAADRWYFVTYTYDGAGGETLYVDAADVTAAGTTLGNFVGTAIGGLSDDSNANRFDGLLQDVIVFDGELTADEVAYLYAARVPAAAIHYDDWHDTASLVTSGSVTATAAGHQLTLTNTGTGTVTGPPNALSTSDRWWLPLRINPDGGTGYQLRFQLLAGTTPVALIAFDGTTLSLDDGDGVSMTSVTPSNWDHDAEQTVYIVGDTDTDTAHFWLLHVDTTVNDRYVYLGSVAMASTPDSFRFDIGATAGTSVITAPIEVWRTADTVGGMGDSIWTGSPAYSPVPRLISNSIHIQTSQLAFWYLSGKYPSREMAVVNFGQGGQVSSYVSGRTAWAGYLQPAEFLVMVGTNDINNSIEPATVIANLTSVIADVIGTYSVPLLLNTVIARPNAIDPDEHELWRAQLNAWIRTTGMRLGASYIDADRITVDPNDNQLLVSSYDADTVHPTVLGYWAIGTGDRITPPGAKLSNILAVSRSLLRPIVRDILMPEYL